MSIKSELKKENIEVIKKLDTMQINFIAKNVAKKLCLTFPDYGLNESNLFINLSRLDMYSAKMEEGMSEANYFYRNNSVYFNEHVNIDDLASLEEFSIHECIHSIQQVKNKNGKLLKLGLCDYSKPKTFGLRTK